MQMTTEPMDRLLAYFGTLATWIEEVDKTGDAIYARRIRDIIDDVQSGHIATTVAFCGLFSAGKSSLINALCETDQLDTGAVPTTEQIATVRLSGSKTDVLLLDTPGVDSTDETHREATMNALFRADMIALVADYQHVEAEENLELLRQFAEEGKRTILVVNQVDKHMDFELSFADFEESVRAVLQDYGMDEIEVFFTSVQASPYSQLDRLRTWLERLGGDTTDGHLEQSQKRLFDIARDAIKSLFAQSEMEARSEIDRLYGEPPLDEAEAQSWLHDAKRRAQSLEESLQAAYQADVEARLARRESWVRGVELAQISPYETTEKGRFFVESLVPDFKVGFFKSAHKTEAEQNRRAAVFAEDLDTRIHNYLLTPLVNQMSDDVRRLGYDSGNVINDLANLHLHVTPNYVRSIVKAGALVSSQYPYQYVKDVVARVKRDVLAQLTTIADGWLEEAKERFFAEHETLEREIQQQHSRMHCLESYLAILQRIREALACVEFGEVPTL